MKEIIVDRLERVVIPKIFRNQLGLSQGTPLDFRVDEESGVLILQKKKNVCIKCHREEELIMIKEGIYICADCYHSLTT